MIGSGAIAASIRVVLGIENGQFTRGLREAEGQTKRSSASMASNMKALEAAQTKVQLEQKRYNETLRVYAKDSVEGLRATERLQRAQAAYARTAERNIGIQARANRELVASERGQVRHTRELAASERALGRAARGAIAGTGAFRGLGRSVAFASTAFLGSAGLFEVTKRSIDLAASQEKQLRRSEILFGENGREVQAWSRTLARSYGLGGESALRYANDFGQILKPLARGPGQAAAMSQRLVRLAADMAAFKNIPIETVLSGLGRGLLGQTRGLKVLGIALDQTSIKAEAVRLGIVKGKFDRQKLIEDQDRIAIAQARVVKAQKDYGAGTSQLLSAQSALRVAQGKLAGDLEGKVPSALSAQQKALAVYSLVLRQTAFQQGFFGKSSGSLEEKLKIVHAQIQNVELTLGTALLPLVVKAVDRFSSWIDRLQRTGQLQRDVNAAVKIGKDVFAALLAIARPLAAIFQGFANAVGGTKHAFELLFALGILKKLGLLKLAIGGIGTEAEAAAGARGLGGLIGVLSSLRKAVLAPFIVTFIVDKITGSNFLADTAGGPGDLVPVWNGKQWVDGTTGKPIKNQAAATTSYRKNYTRTHPGAGRRKETTWYSFVDLKLHEGMPPAGWVYGNNGDVAGWAPLSFFQGVKGRTAVPPGHEPKDAIQTSYTGARGKVPPPKVGETTQAEGGHRVPSPGAGGNAQIPAEATPRQRRQLSAVLGYVAHHGAGSGGTYERSGTGQISSVHPQGVYDCSGFLYAAYKAAGVTIPRTSEAQFHDPNALDVTGQERAGDGVYFNEGPDPAPGHCGIMVDGQRFVEYFSKGKPAKVSYLGDKQGVYAGARRWIKILGETGAGATTPTPSTSTKPPPRKHVVVGAKKKGPGQEALVPVSIREPVAAAEASLKGAPQSLRAELALQRALAKEEDYLVGQIRKSTGERKIKLERELGRVRAEQGRIAAAVDKGRLKPFENAVTAAKLTPSLLDDLRAYKAEEAFIEKALVGAKGDRRAALLTELGRVRAGQAKIVVREAKRETAEVARLPATTAALKSFESLQGGFSLVKAKIAGVEYLKKQPVTLEAWRKLKDELIKTLKEAYRRRAKLQRAIARAHRIGQPELAASEQKELTKLNGTIRQLEIDLGETLDQIHDFTGESSAEAAALQREFLDEFHSLVGNYAPNLLGGRGPGASAVRLERPEAAIASAGEPAPPPSRKPPAPAQSGTGGSGRGGRLSGVGSLAALGLVGADVPRPAATSPLRSVPLPRLVTPGLLEREQRQIEAALRHVSGDRRARLLEQLTRIRSTGARARSTALRGLYSLTGAIAPPPSRARAHVRLVEQTREEERQIEAALKGADRRPALLKRLAVLRSRHVALPAAKPDGILEAALAFLEQPGHAPELAQVVGRTRRGLAAEERELETSLKHATGDRRTALLAQLARVRSAQAGLAGRLPRAIEDPVLASAIKLLDPKRSPLAGKVTAAALARRGEEGQLERAIRGARGDRRAALVRQLEKVKAEHRVRLAGAAHLAQQFGHRVAPPQTALRHLPSDAGRPLHESGHTASALRTLPSDAGDRRPATIIELHNHFPHPPTKDFNREAIYARAAVRAAFD